MTKKNVLLLLMVALMPLFVGCGVQRDTDIPNEVETIKKQETSQIEFIPVQTESNKSEAPSEILLDENEADNGACSEEIGALIANMFEKEDAHNCILISPTIRQVGNFYEFANSVDNGYLYYSIITNNADSGLYKMDLNEDLTTIEKISDKLLYNAVAANNNIFAVHYDKYGNQHYLVQFDKYGYASHQGSSSFRGTCIIDDYMFSIHTEYAESTKYATHETYSLYKTSSAYSAGPDQISRKLFNTEIPLEIIGCFDNGTFLVYFNDPRDIESKYVIFDQDGNQIKEISQYQAEAFTFGRNSEIAMSYFDDDNGIRKYGFVLENGEFIEDEFINMLATESYSFYTDVDFNKGTIYYLTSDGNIRSHSLVSGKDDLITCDYDANGILFATGNYIYYTEYHSNGLNITRCKLDGTESQNVTLSMVWNN